MKVEGGLRSPAERDRRRPERKLGTANSLRQSGDENLVACRRLVCGEAALYRAMRLESLMHHPDCYGWTYEEEARAPQLAFESAIEEDPPDRFLVGAFRTERLIGIAGFARLARRKTLHRGEITQVYVDPAARGGGVGWTLLRTLLAMAFGLSEIEQVELGVIATNAGAIRLYASLNFEVIARLENFFKLGDDRWDQYRMRLTRETYLRCASGP